MSDNGSVKVILQVTKEENGLNVMFNPECNMQFLAYALRLLNLQYDNMMIQKQIEADKKTKPNIVIPKSVMDRLIQ